MARSCVQCQGLVIRARWHLIMVKAVEMADVLTRARPLWYFVHLHVARRDTPVVGRAQMTNQRPGSRTEGQWS